MADQNYYSSQKHAAASVGIDVELVKQACAEDAGLTGSGGRIHKEKLAAWLKDYEWRKKQPAETAPKNSMDVEDDAGIYDIKRARELVGLRKELLDLDKARDSLLPLADFQKNLSAMLAAFRAALNAVPGRVSSKIVQRARGGLLVMLKEKLPAKTFEKVEEAILEAPIDFADIIEILEAEMDIVLLTLGGCDYIEGGE